MTIKEIDIEGPQIRIEYEHVDASIRVWVDPENGWVDVSIPLSSAYDDWKHTGKQAFQSASDENSDWSIYIKPLK